MGKTQTKYNSKSNRQRKIQQLVASYDTRHGLILVRRPLAHTEPGKLQHLPSSNIAHFHFRFCGWRRDTNV